MRKLEEIQQSILHAEPGKLADTMNEALKEIESSASEATKIGSASFWGLNIVMAAIGNIDERLCNELDKFKGRLARLEEATFGMTYDEAQATVNSYIEAVKENPDIEASEQVKKAERIIGV